MTDRFTETIRAVIDDAVMQIAAMRPTDIERAALVKARYAIAEAAGVIMQQWHVASQIERLMVRRHGSRTARAKGGAK